MTRLVSSLPAMPLCLLLCPALGALGCASTVAPAESTTAERAEASAASEAPPPAPAAAEPTPAAPPAAAPEPADTRSKEQIQAVIAANRERVRACYDAAQQKDPGLQGDLLVAFVINPDGSVKSAEVNAQESEIHSPELDSCAVGVLQTLKFPASSRGLESRVNYPFNFKPSAPPPPR